MTKVKSHVSGIISKFLWRTWNVTSHGIICKNLLRIDSKLLFELKQLLLCHCELFHKVFTVLHKYQCLFKILYENILRLWILTWKAFFELNSFIFVMCVKSHVLYLKMSTFWLEMIQTPFELKRFLGPFDELFHKVCTDMWGYSFYVIKILF